MEPRHAIINLMKQMEDKHNLPCDVLTKIYEMEEDVVHKRERKLGSKLWQVVLDASKNSKRSGS